MEKNSVIKLGRVRLRVRAIDYPNDKYEGIESVSDKNVMPKGKTAASTNEVYTDKQDSLAR